MWAGTSLDVDRELEALTRQLADELEGQVDRPVVEQAVKAARQEFGEPPITQFLPILIRRRVKARLTG